MNHWLRSTGKQTKLNLALIVQPDDADAERRERQCECDPWEAVGGISDWFDRFSAAVF